MNWIQFVVAIISTLGTIGVVFIQTGKLLNRMDSLEVRMDKLEVRMDKFEERMNNFEKRLNKLAIAVSNIRTRLKRIERINR